LTKSISKCGMDCSICPWSKEVKDSMTAEQYEDYKVGCKNTLGFSPSGPFQNCVGCQTPEDEWPKGTRIPFKNCSIRLCVLKSNLNNCAFCSRFPCDSIKLKANEWSKEKVEKRMNKKTSDEDYKKYISPFEAYRRLEAIHSKLSPDQIISVVTLPLLETTVIAFPDSLENIEIGIQFFKEVHELILKISKSNLGLEDIDTYAQQVSLKTKIKHLIRFLWIIGNQAIYKKEEQTILLDAKPFIKNRFSETALGAWSYMENFVLKKFKEFGIICEFIQLSKEKIGPKGWITPTGALRDRNWQMKITFTEELSGNETFQALQFYTRKLDKEYGKHSFRYFAKADMRVLLN